MSEEALAPREATVQRKTLETEVAIRLNLDGTGASEVFTGVGFLDHMLRTFARHGYFDLQVSAKGDLEVDAHHTVEDTALVLGMAFAEALGDKRGINRFGWACVPMDEALVTASVDLSGRPFFAWHVRFPSEKIGEFDTELIPEFWRALANTTGMNLHILLHYGENSHHIAEATFKAVARALCQAVAHHGRTGDIPSTKGAL